MKKIYMLLAFVMLAGASSLAQNKELSERLIKKYKTAQQGPTTKDFKKQDYLWLSPLLREAFNNWEDLTQEAKELFSAYSNRPTFTGTEQILTSGNFALHYTTDGPEGESISSEDLDNNSIPDYAESMLETFVAVAEKYHTTLGMVLPPNDGDQTNNAYYDIYISGTEAGEWVYGYVAGESNIGDNPNSTDLTEQFSYSSYMVMRNNYEGFGDVQKAMEVTAAHEYMHAVQMGYDGYMDSWFMEAAATWSEEYAFPGHDDNFQYLSNIFETPDIALDLKNGEFEGAYDDHWYGAWIYVQFLTEHTGNSIIKNIYERSINEWSIYAINDELSANWSTDFISNFFNFATGNLLMTNAHTLFQAYTYSRASDYSTHIGSISYENNSSVFDFSGTTINWDSQTNGNARLHRLSADYFRLSTDRNFTIELTNSSNDQLKLVLVKLNLNNHENITYDIEIAENTGIINVTNYSDWSHLIPFVIRYDAMSQYAKGNKIESLKKATPKAESATYSLKISPATTTDVADIEDAEFTIYPNPVSNVVSIKTSAQAQLYAKIADLSGKIILEKTLDNSKQIDVSTLENGVYIISVSNENEIVRTQKIIISH